MYRNAIVASALTLVGPRRAKPSVNAAPTSAISEAGSKAPRSTTNPCIRNCSTSAADNSCIACIITGLSRPGGSRASPNTG
jgi:hypothetical protein